MTAVHHILIAVAYTLLAAVAAIAAPRVFPQIGPGEGAVLGAFVLIGCALLHEIFARQEGEAHLADHVEALHAQNGRLHAELDDMAAQVTALKGDVAALRTEAAEEGAGSRRVDSVIAEVKVLQGLVEQMAAVRPAGAARLPKPDAAPEPGGGARTAPAATEPDAAPAAAAAAPRAMAPIALVARDGRAIPPAREGMDDDSILAIVQDGLERNRVDLVLQPIVRLPQRRTLFYEAFTRIRDADGAVLVPEQYIAIAEREGLITAIDNMLLFRCVQLVRRTQSRDRDIGFFCNISAHSLTDRHFFSNFVEFMADNTQLAPNLIFEFPYATIANRDEEIEAHLRHLASLGFRFSVDQVSSLNIDYEDLRRHRFRYVKMDAETVLRELEDPRAHLSVEDIKRIVDRHGMDLIIEKIETEQALLELLDLRVDFGQGYLFGEPRLARVE